MAEKDISTYTVLDPAAGDVALGTRGEAEGSTAYRFRLDALMPPGMILPYGGSSAPSGWLSCDGSAVSRATYADLFDAIGTTWGAGDGSTTFNVPDMREVAPVGVGTRGAGAAADVFTLGQFKDDQMQGHWHSMAVNTTGTPANGFIQITSNTGPAALVNNISAREPIDDGGNGTPRTGTVTRGKRIGVLYCIKA